MQPAFHIVELAPARGLLGPRTLRASDRPPALPVNIPGHSRRERPGRAISHVGDVIQAPADQRVQSPR